MKVNIESLRPTQYAIGKYEVEKKIQFLKPLLDHPEKLKDFKRLNRAPAINWDGSLYIVDHHHLTSALLELHEEYVYVEVIKDYTGISESDFWNKMKRHSWVYLKDNEGKDITPDLLPTKLKDMKDDPYRSLAGRVRDMGCYNKTAIPYAEFQWADFFRCEGMSERLTRKSLRAACILSKSNKAKDLPGYKGRM